MSIHNGFAQVVSQTLSIIFTTNMRSIKGALHIVTKKDSCSYYYHYFQGPMLGKDKISTELENIEQMCHPLFLTLPGTG